MPENLPHDYEMSPRFRVLDSAVRGSHGEGAQDWQLHLIKLPSWNYSFLWLCPLPCGDGGFIALDARFDREIIFSATETLQSLEKQSDSIIGEGALARRFVLNTRGLLRAGNQRAHETLTVRPDGVSAWSDRKDYEETAFRWRQTPFSGADFVQMPAAQIWAELQILLANPNSEANFAREYARLTSLQRRERIQRPTRGALDELNRLLRDVVLASPQWNELGDGELFLSVDKSGAAQMWEIGHGHPDTLETPDFVRENVRALWNYFQPFDRDVSNFLCVQNSNENSLFARAFRPSAHQQIEAQLRLRDWTKMHLQKGQCRE